VANIPIAGRLSARRVKRSGKRRVWAIVLGTIVILFALLVAFPYQFGYVAHIVWNAILNLVGQ
jgi:Na+/melibiose symporter-like transporter